MRKLRSACVIGVSVPAILAFATAARAQAGVADEGPPVSAYAQFARVTPYVAADVGLDRYVFADATSTGQILARTSTALSLNAGGGLRIRSTQNLGLHTDMRWSNGLGSRAPERWRLYNGVTWR